jgi:predicted lipoprotein with Yx(FWY)xxD motif
VRARLRGPERTTTSPRTAAASGLVVEVDGVVLAEAQHPGGRELAAAHDGGLADAAGKPLYTFDYDTMLGMSHCEDDCAQMWPPLLATKAAKAFGAWTLVPRSGGLVQWAYKDKPLYTYSQDQPGQAAAGTEAPKWKRAK